MADDSIPAEVYDLKLKVEELASWQQKHEVHIDFIVPIEGQGRGAGSQRLGVFKEWKPRKRQILVYCASLTRHFNLEINQIKKAWVGQPGDYWKTRILFPDPPKPKKKGKKEGSK